MQALRRSFGYWQQVGAVETVVADLNLRPGRRQELAGRLLAALQDWIPGSSARLRGSLATGAADDYSDIDICWEVPDAPLAEAADTAAAGLSQVRAVSSLRTDPDLAASAMRRLIFAHLSDVLEGRH